MGLLTPFDAYEAAPAEVPLGQMAMWASESFVFWMLCTTTFVPMLSRATSPGYAKLSRSNRLIWDLKGVRSLFSILCVYMSAKAVFLTDSKLMTENLALGRNVFTDWSLGWITGFFAFENAVLAYVKLTYDRIDRALLVHHLLGIWVYGYSAVTGVGHYLTLLYIFEEVSVPFTGISWYIEKGNGKNNPLWILNQTVLVIVWVVGRMFVDAFGMSMIVGNWEQVVAFPVHYKICCMVSIPTLALFLNPYWLKKKLGSLLSVLKVRWASSSKRAGHVVPAEVPPSPLVAYSNKAAKLTYSNHNDVVLGRKEE